MIPVLLLATVLVPASPERTPEQIEEESYGDVVDLFRDAALEPEPPAGLRAPAGTDRHKRARRRYAAALQTWRETETSRRDRLIRLCTEHLERHPNGKQRLEVLYMRGATRFQGGHFKEARDDLAGFLTERKTGAEAAAARVALVAACRAEGDYAAALRWGGPDPDLLEEAGQIDRAMAAARVAGLLEKARKWRMIGKPFPGEVKIPTSSAVAIVEVGKSLPPERKKALQTAYAEKLAIFSFSSSQTAIYVLDSAGIVHAVDPRPDSLHHRIAHLLGRR